MIILLLVVLGLVEGSMLTALTHRLATGLSMVTGRSACPTCRHTLGPLDLVPLMSALVLGGRCRYCRARISLRYPMIEGATVIANLLLFVTFGLTWIMLWAVVVTGFLLVIFVYDLEHQLILDRVVLPAFLIGLTGNLLFGRSLFDLLTAAILGGGFFLTQYLLSHGRWIGGGDIRLGALMGVLLGVAGVAAALFLAYLSGAVVSIGLVLFRRKRWKSMVPFGTFLTAATFVTLLFGSALLDWYLGLLQ
ncbi:MAG: prepilin peptidase [Candidatus Kerfeldbacteria bacterium]|nr:prepilin peptidase [Candidatus Kerfeldbacteria bacterium]